jgi:hypothetical protein
LNCVHERQAPGSARPSTLKAWNGYPQAPSGAGFDEFDHQAAGARSIGSRDATEEYARKASRSTCSRRFSRESRGSTNRDLHFQYSSPGASRSRAAVHHGAAFLRVIDGGTRGRFLDSRTKVSSVAGGWLRDFCRSF